MRIDRHIGVVQEDIESAPPVTGIGQHLRQWIARQQSLSPELRVDPGEELNDDRLGVRQPIIQSLGGGTCSRNTSSTSGTTNRPLGQVSSSTSGALR